MRPSFSVGIAEEEAKGLPVQLILQPSLQRAEHPPAEALPRQSVQLHHAGLDALLQTDAFIQVTGVSAVISRAVFAAHIQQAVEAGTQKIKPPKSVAGKRSVPIPDWYLNMLRKIPVSINKTDFVFFCTNSQPISKQRFERAWKSLLREMDICAGAKLYRNQIVESKIDYTITPYFLRHTYCTMLCEKGVPLKTAQYLMGHASIEMTAEIYTHVTENMLESARLQINNTSKEKCCRNVAQ